MQTVGGRLREALRVRRKTRADLSRALKERGIRGASPPSLKTYIEGTYEPRLELLLAAADFLGVNPEWLRTGEGPVTPGEAPPVAADPLRGAGAGLDVPETFEEGLHGAEEVLPWLRGPRVDPGTRTVIAQAVWAQGAALLSAPRRLGGRFTATAEGAGQAEAGERAREVGGVVARALLAPLEVLDVDPDTLGSTALRRFFATVAQAVAALGTDLSDRLEREEARALLDDFLFAPSQEARAALLAGLEAEVHPSELAQFPLLAPAVNARGEETTPEPEEV